MDTAGLEVIAEVAIGLAGFSGLFVALTQSRDFEPPERVRLQFLLYTSLGAMFLAMLPYVVFTRPWSEQTMWTVLGTLVTLHTAFLAYFLFQAISLSRTYPDLFTTRIMLVQGSLIVASFGLSVAVLLAPLEGKPSYYIGALLTLLAQASIVFTRLLFYRRS